MNKEASSIFEETGCLSEQQLTDYLEGRLSRAQMHAVEAHVAGCDFCGDALEGLMEVSHKEQIPVIVKQIHGQVRRELQSHLARKKRVKLYVWLTAIIAVVLLILLVAFFAIYYTEKREKQQRQPPAPRQHTVSRAGDL